MSTAEHLFVRTPTDDDPELEGTRASRTPISHFVEWEIEDSEGARVESVPCYHEAEARNVAASKEVEGLHVRIVPAGLRKRVVAWSCEKAQAPQVRSFRVCDSPEDAGLLFAQLSADGFIAVQILGYRRVIAPTSARP